MSCHEPRLPGQTPWPELHPRIFALADALREHGLVWRPFADRTAEAQSRRSRIPDEVVTGLKDFLREVFARARGTPTAEDSEWVFRRFRELSAPLWEPGETLAGMDPEAAHVLRGRCIPNDVAAEMKGLLAELRAAFRAKTTQEELTSFVRHCREKARSDLYHFLFPDRAADFEALAERSERERTVYLEEHELLRCEHPEQPVWGEVVFIEPGERGGVELRTFPNPDMAEVFHHRTEPTMDTYMSLWWLVTACESGFGGLRTIEAVSACGQ